MKLLPPVTVTFPATFMGPPTPTPPLTTNAPVVAFVDAVVLVVEMTWLPKEGEILVPAMAALADTSTSAKLPATTVALKVPAVLVRSILAVSVTATRVLPATPMTAQTVPVYSYSALVSSVMARSPEFPDGSEAKVAYVGTVAVTVLLGKKDVMVTFPFQ
jgi:hypothetical protein